MDLNIPADYEIGTLSRLSKLMTKMYEGAEKLNEALENAPADEALETARYSRDQVLPGMRALMFPPEAAASPQAKAQS